MNPVKILVADADAELLDALGYLLRREGYTVFLAQDGTGALRLWEEEDPALVVLEAMLPGISGLEVCRQIRKSSGTPLVLLSEASDEETIVRGLDLGADDYVTKPFGPRQLLARIRAVLRRSQASAGRPSAERAQLTVGDLSLDPQYRIVEHAGVTISLTPTEFRLLYELVLHEGQVLTHRVLVDRVWGYAFAEDTNVIKGQIYNLRRKLEKDLSHPSYIRTVPGSGYTFLRRGGLNPDTHTA